MPGLRALHGVPHGVLAVRARRRPGLVIALSQLRMRRELDAAGIKPGVRVWAFPALTWLTIGFIAVVLVMMAILPGQRLELWFSIALAPVTVDLGVRSNKGKHPLMIRRR